MNDWIFVLLIAALLGSALVGGIFFAFSTFIMKALARVPSSEGIRTMQSINITVINPAFLGVFLGTAVLSAVIVLLSLGVWSESLSHWFFVGALQYVIGTFLVTVFGNVPLNNRLESILPEDGEKLWAHYLSKWTFWNHIRTMAAIVAAFCFTMGLLQS
ncbi:MAG: DUF1772 domain-containing protein [Verrucomicrobiae bacterium]|nr:DUF1772 domain-containing protein [Verrucomicrobiae bacterium]